MTITTLCDCCLLRPAEIRTGHGKYCEPCATPSERAEDRDRRETLRDMDATAKRAEWLDDVEGRTDHGREDAREAAYERDHRGEF